MPNTPIRTRYNFKFFEEALWAMFITFLVFVGSEFLLTDNATNWRVWAIAALSGGARAAVGVLLSYLRQPAPEPPAAKPRRKPTPKA